MRRCLASFLLAAFLALPGPSVLAEQLAGRVVGVVDGDTLDVLTMEKVLHRIRVDGIDAPERRQAFGNVSKNSLSDLAFEKDVLVQVDKRDRYGRMVGKVTHQGLDLGLMQVRRGLAWHYKKYALEQTPADRAAYDRAERLARVDGKGIWSEAAPIAPWDFRRRPKK